MYSGKQSLISVFLILSFLLSIIPSVHAAEPLWTYSSPGSEIGGVTVSSDGSVVAVGAGKICLFSKNGVLLVKEPFGEQVIFTPDGSSLVASYGSTLYQFKRKVPSQGSEPPLQKVWELALPATVHSIDISDDGNTVVASVNGGGTYIFTSSGKMVGGDDRFNAIVRVSSSGSRTIGVSQGVLCRYGRTSKCWKSEEEVVGALPDFMEITSSGNITVFNDDQKIRSVVINSNNNTLRWIKRATGDVTSLTMTPSGSTIIAGTDNGNVDQFDEYGNISWSYASNPSNKQSSGITAVAISKGGTVAAAGSYDGKIFALNSKGEEIWANQTKDRISHIAMSADGSLVVATGENTVYAFSNSVKSAPVVRTTVKSSIPAQIQPITTIRVSNSTQKPTPTEPPSQEITPEPTVYSVIRTSTQSPLPAVIPLGAVFVVLLIVIRRL